MFKKYISGISIGLMLGLGLFNTPFFDDAANAAVKSAKKDIKKSASKKISSKTGKRKAVRTVAKASNKKNSSQSGKDNEREIWLKRSKSSDILTGKASWYGKDFHNKATASGLKYDMHTFTAAHRTLPMGTIVKVTDQNNGKSVMVCVTDRGPYVHGRLIDLSYAAAKQLGLNKKGVSNVALEVISDENGAPLKKGQAYYVKYSAASGKNIVGPFHAFADAAAMHEALRQAHPEAEVVLGKDNGK